MTSLLRRMNGAIPKRIGSLLVTIITLTSIWHNYASTYNSFLLSKIAYLVFIFWVIPNFAIPKTSTSPRRQVTVSMRFLFRLYGTKQKTNLFYHTGSQRSFREVNSKVPWSQGAKSKHWKRFVWYIYIWCV